MSRFQAQTTCGGERINEGERSRGSGFALFWQLNARATCTFVPYQNLLNKDIAGQKCNSVLHQNGPVVVVFFVFFYLLLWLEKKEGSSV